MKILLSSHVFHPSTGGIETISLLLAEEFTCKGHEVQVVTQTPATEPDEFSFKVIRNPDSNQLLQLLRWSDVYLQNNISLQTLWPVYRARRPLVIAHHTWLYAEGQRNLAARIKEFVVRRSHSIAISRAMAEHVGGSPTIIGNCYRDDLFREIPDAARELEFVFVGRLVSDKGVATLLKALALLHGEGQPARLTVVGHGPELENLKALADELGIAQSVTFAGIKRDEELVQLINRHKIMVVPSEWNEPFGIVALEGIACGCVIIGSEAGGLPDAIGSCGVLYPNGDVEQLKRRMQELLTQPDLIKKFRAAAPEHLKRHTMAVVANQYLQVLEKAAGKAS